MSDLIEAPGLRVEGGRLVALFHTFDAGICVSTFILGEFDSEAEALAAIDEWLARPAELRC